MILAYSMPDHMQARSLFGQPRAVVEAALPDREAVTCPMCRMEPRPVAVDFQGFHVARCLSCGLEFQSPRPVFSQLAETVYGSTYHPPGEELVGSVRAQQFARQVSHLKALLPASRRVLLDVGCGAGAFLRFAEACGWQANGTDVVLTEEARKMNRRLWEGQLPTISFSGARFDVVRFNHVLEHTQDPLAELRRARELLTPQGIVLIGVPNLAGVSNRLKTWQSRLSLKGKPWKHYGALHHLWFFTPSTLTRMVAAAGFDVEWWETPVFSRPDWSGWTTAAARVPLESVRAGGVVDLYARVS